MQIDLGSSLTSIFCEWSVIFNLPSVVDTNLQNSLSIFSPLGFLSILALFPRSGEAQELKDADRL